MSARRARIKAVTALPPRRKNVENNDNNKPQLDAVNNDSEKTKSPRIPQLAKQHSVAESSPLKAVPSPVRVRTPVTVVNITPETKDNTQISHKKSSVTTQELAEKVPVITSTSSTKSVFLSPQVRTNSQRKVTQLTPKLESKNKEISVTSEGNKQHDSVCKDDTTKLNVQNSATKESTNKDDYIYIVPIVPASGTEDAVMDGIIPLQTARNAPKPIALLKNEIISENAEVLFDPIVPLPSPSKVRPKLRPVPRLGPLRRNSVQGSASESEDENRRALLSGSTVPATPTAPRQRNDSHTSHSTLHSQLNKEVNRVRNDSVCSSMSQAAVQPAAGSPVKDKNYGKSRRQYMNRRMAAMRRRRETVKRDTLTMYDLIFYNPTTKPIVPDQDEIEAKEASQLDAKAAQEQEEEVDDPPANDAAPVPQMKLGPNGEIVLDEQSLVIKNSGSRQVSGVVREGAWSSTRSAYRRPKRTADWTDEETVRFYRALAALGTDFTMMEQLFPGRKRADLKKKFKKEERLNGAQVDRALKAGTLWDVSKLCEEFIEERAATRKAIKEQSDRLIKEKMAEKARQQAVRDFKLKQFSPSKTVKILSNISVSRGVCNSEFTISLDGKPLNPGNTEAVRDSKTPTNSNIDAIKERTPRTYSKNEITKDKTPRTASNIEITSRDNRTPSHDISSVVPKNIETGSLVVLTVEDPNAPTKKILQTYISNDKGSLTPISLPSNLLNSVVGYMNKGTPKSSVSVASSPSVISPNGVVTHEGRGTPSVIQVTPVKRKRNSSYTMTQL
ncbi:hypothetical protein K1T71_010328 [Dendrolimus kikuchii]|uniref:Uncharacterized protein n=1 Tax=Dendrolimus kikuchii TaxID=765133 RepID=A0ACC1CRG4_9NEOP|nr:hypothetical protein K1T71_010328 [Dendrolimus kikuchii]